MASKTKLPFIILGMLNEEELSGYDLKRKFENEIGEFWQAKTSQIYPSLKMLLEDGAVHVSTEIVGEKLQKKIYHITDYGREALTHWMESPVEEFPVQKDEFMLKLYFQDAQSQPEIQRLMTEELVQHQKKIHHLTERKELLFATEAQRSSEYGHFLILDFAIKREQLKIEWLESVLNGTFVAEWGQHLGNPPGMCWPEIVGWA